MRRIQRDALVGLAVDDNRGLRCLIATVISDSGLVPTVCADGLAAWHLVDTLRPTVVVTDLDMPAMNGQELIHNIRRNERKSGRRTAIILCSGALWESHIFEAMDAGADFFLPKPINVMMLKRILQQIARVALKKSDGPDPVFLDREYP